jgi:hypothetical protein
MRPGYPTMRANGWRGAVAVAEVVVLPGLADGGRAGGDGVPVEQDLDSADVAGEVPGLGVRLGGRAYRR